MTDDGAGDQGRPWWTVVLGIGVVLVVVVAVSGALGRPELPSATAPDQDVELPERAEVEARDDAPCETAACELWRVPFGGGQVRMTDRFAVRLGAGGVTAVDLANGDVVWQAEVADGDTSLYADDQVVVIAFAATDDAGVRLATFETATGTPGFDRTYGGLEAVRDIQRIADMLVLDVTPSVGEPRGARVVVDRTGVVTDRHDDAGRAVRWRNGLVEAGAGTVSGVAERDQGIVTWRTDGEWTDIDLTAGRVLVRTPSGDYHVHDIRSGLDVWSTPGDGVQQAQFVGTWVGLTFENGLEVIDPEDGTARFVREGVAATTRLVHLALDRHTVVLWPVDAGVELGVYDEAGDEVLLLDVAGDDPAATWATLAPVAGHPDVVQIVTDAGRDSRWLSLPGGEEVRRSVDEDPGPWNRDFRDGLLWRSRTGELVLEGPAGSLAVDGAAEVLSVDPLVVHGPDALVRLDPAAVFGAVAAG